MVILQHCVILHVLGKDTWMLIFWSFLSKMFIFWVWFFFFSFLMEHSWGQDQGFFFIIIYVAKF
jgi:hypothetical protein